MPLRGLKHFVPHSRQAQSVYGMIKFLLENSAGSADNASCISSFSDLGQAKKAVFRLPRGKRGLVSFNKTTALQPSWCDFSLRKQSLRNNLELLFASCFYLFPCLLMDSFRSVWWQQQPPMWRPSCWADGLPCFIREGPRQRNFCCPGEMDAGLRGSLPRAESAPEVLRGLPPGCADAQGDSEPNQTCRDRSF